MRSFFTLIPVALLCATPSLAAAAGPPASVAPPLPPVAHAAPRPPAAAIVAIAPPSPPSPPSEPLVVLAPPPPAAPAAPRVFRFGGDDGPAVAWHPHSGERLGTQVSGMSEELRDFFGAPGDAGILVQRVEPGSAAEAAKVHVGDVIVEIDGHRIEAIPDVHEALAGRSGDTVKVVVVRAKKRKTLKASFESAPASGRVEIPPIEIPPEAMRHLPPEAREQLERELDEVRRQLREVEREIEQATREANEAADEAEGRERADDAAGPKSKGKAKAKKLGKAKRRRAKRRSSED